MNITPEQWDLVCNELKVSLGDQTFMSWFEQVFVKDDETPEQVSLMAATAFISDYIKDNYHADIQEAFNEVLESSTNIAYGIGIKSKKHTEKSILRSVPVDDMQRDMFVPDITEIPIKDDVHLMEVAPFTLQPRGEDRNELVYSGVRGVDIRIEANPKYGLITALDYDLVLMMQSWLAEAANEYKAVVAKYKKQGHKSQPPKPARYFEPSIREILLFARNYEKSGANQRERVEAMLNRLKNCNVKISRASRKKRRWGSFSFIHDWEILEESATGNIQKVRIEIPSWIYEGIVEAPTPTILTYDPDYFLLKQPALRFMYRFCRLQDRELKESLFLDFSLADMHMRSGSRRPQKFFNKDLRDIVKSLPEGVFFNWILTIEGKRDSAVLRLRRQHQQIENQ